MKMRVILLALAATGALAISTELEAALVTFNITGANSYSFTLPQSPTPNGVGNGFFQLNSVTVNVNGNSCVINVGFQSDGGLGSSAGNCSPGSTLGFEFPGTLNPLLFSGTLNNPTFLLGNYSLLGGPPGSDPTRYSLSITQGTGAVPEPATWAMMLLGFGAIGYAMRRKARVAVPA